MRTIHQIIDFGCESLCPETEFLTLELVLDFPALVLGKKQTIELIGCPPGKRCSTIALPRRF